MAYGSRLMVRSAYVVVYDSWFIWLHGSCFFVHGLLNDLWFIWLHGSCFIVHGLLNGLKYDSWFMYIVHCTIYCSSCFTVHSLLNGFWVIVHSFTCLIFYSAWFTKWFMDHGLRIMD